MKERQEKIYAILNERGNATVEQLKLEVFASEATIRRDLITMEREGLLVRVWGGAILSNKSDCDPPVFVRFNSNIEAKKRIARNAIGFLHDNASVFLPSGTTVSELVKLFGLFKGLTVITTGLDIIQTLNQYSSIKVLSTGGELYEHYDFAGTIAGNNIENFTADLFFFSCSGITENGFTSQDMARLDIIRKMQKNSAKTILLADTSKVGKQCTYKGFGFDKIDYVVMEKLPNDEALIKALGNKLVVKPRE